MMNNCNNDIVRDSLSIEIDISNPLSWDLNSGLTTTSITKSKKSYSDNIDLFDYGLTQFDAGYSKNMWDKYRFNVDDNYFKLKRVGKNIVNNPTVFQTTGLTSEINYDDYTITPIITGNCGNYFELNGGYLQGFFKLNGYNYEILPSRYSRGISIETILYLKPNSSGFYFMMGCRAEDKYNPYFTGETNTTINNGVYTSNDNLLDSFMGRIVNKKSFINVEEKEKTIYSEPNALANIKNNVIGFEITPDKHLGYKYINDNGNIITDKSNQIINNTGFTIIDITFKPEYVITDPDILHCTKQRKGELTFFINGRPAWIVKDFPEFYFKSINNDHDKQIGIPYNISWGGGSFGLKHSYHYDYQTYQLYTGQDIDYVNNNYDIVDADLNITNGLELIIDNDTFINNDDETPIDVIKLDYTGNTDNKKFLLLFNKPISIISNREYEFNLKLYNNGFFKKFDELGNYINNKISLHFFSDETDIEVIEYTEYIYPLTTESETFISGVNEWCDVFTKINSEINSGQKNIRVGIMIETTHDFNLNSSLFIESLTYTGSDILVKDPSKDNLLIEQNFDNSFNGGIQKLRIYEKPLNSMEVLNNSIIESKNNPNYLLNIRKGGRIIYK